MALALHPEVEARFLERGLHRPTAHEVEDDLRGLKRQVRRKQRLGFETPFRVTHQHESGRPPAAYLRNTTRRCRWPTRADGPRRRTHKADTAANGCGPA